MEATLLQPDEEDDDENEGPAKVRTSGDEVAAELDWMIVYSCCCGFECCVLKRKCV